MIENGDMPTMLPRTVPDLILYVFQQFPLKSFPLVEKSTSESDAFMLKRKVYLDPAAAKTSQDNSYFTLAVYGLFEYSFGKKKITLATDPTCLFALLSLIYKNDLLLPRQNNSVSFDTPQNSVIAVSYHASKDGELPILFENPQRIVRSNYAINELNLSRIENSKDYVLVELLDRVFYDAWLFTVITELSKQQIAQLYSVVDVENPILNIDTFYENEKSTCSKFSLIADLPFKALLVRLLQRNQFSLRNPSISSNFHKWLPNCLSFGNLTSFFNSSAQDQRLAQEIEEIFDSLAETLQILRKLLASRASAQYDTVSLLDVKLASYLICIKTFLKGSRIFKMIQDQYPDLFDMCDKILEKFAS